MHLVPRALLIAVACAVPLLASCDLLRLLLCDPEADPTCADPTLGALRGTITLPRSGPTEGQALRIPRGPEPAWLLDARAQLEAAMPVGRPGLPLASSPTSQAAPGAFRPGEVIVRGRASLRADRAGAAQALAEVLDDGTRVSLRLCNSDALCLAELKDRAGRPLDAEATLEAALRLQHAPLLRYAETNLILHANRVPNDAFYSLQWHYGAIDLEAAWDVTVGDPDIVAAVIDTGIVAAHPELAPRLARTVDLIDDVEVARDGDGRDDDGDDPGDEACGSGCHSHHGSHVAGTMAAATDNGAQVSGVTWSGQVLAVRALGVGGGSLFDIAGGLLWAIGDDVDGVPRNPTPADVINLSIGASGSSDAMNEAVQRAIDAGAIVVVAAGNEDVDASGSTPANAPGVIAVAATSNVGAERGVPRRASYSNFGATVTLAAPGGEQAEDVDGDGEADGVLSTVSDFVTFYQGTSMAAPHVAGIAMLLKSLDPSINQARASELLRATADPQVTCAEGCGAGLVNAARALRRLRGDGNGPFVVASPPTLRVGRGDTDAVVRFKNIGGQRTSVALTTGGANRDKIAIDVDKGALDELQTLTVRVSIAREGDDRGEATIRASFDGGSAEARVAWSADAIRILDSVHVGALRVGDDGALSVEAITTTNSLEGLQYTLTGLTPGTYLIVGLTDDDNDGAFERREGVGVFASFDDPRRVEVVAGALVDGLDFLVAPGFAGDDTAAGGTGTGGVGAPCTGSPECAGGLYCERDLPGGYCTQACTNDVDCGAGQACFRLARTGGDPYQTCLKRCASDGDCGRSDGDYGCDADLTCFPGGKDR